MDLIKRFNEYFDMIRESLNSPIEISYRVDTNNELIGYFKVNKVIYKIECKKQIGNNWSYSFSFLDNGKWSFDMLNNQKGQFTILATIKKGLYSLFETKSPHSIIFSAVDKNETRKRLYKKFCDDFCQENEMKLSNQGSGEAVLYLLFNDNISISDKDDAFNSVKKVIEEGK